jgi:hypothetical protein
MLPTAELRRWTGLAAACQAGPLRNGVRPDMAQPTHRACPHRAGAHGARGTVGLPRGHRRPRCIGKSTTSTTTSTRTRRAPTRRGVGSVYGLTSGEVGLRDTMLPSLPVRREMTGGVGHSRQRRGLDKGAGCEALTGDGRRSGQSSGGVAVPSFSWCSCARRRVRRWEGAATAVNQRGKRRMEELTGVVRLMETEQR